MHVPASVVAIAAIIAPTLAYAVPGLIKRDGALKVQLSQATTTEVSATLTNAGNEALKLLDYGTLMDTNPVQKVNVFKDGSEVGFTGISVRYKMYDLTEDAFTTLQPGESFTSTIDIAALHDIGGGEYTVSTVGAIPYAKSGTTEVDGSIAYESNVLALTLTEEDVAVVPRAVPVVEKRAAIRSCSGTNGDKLRQALSQSASLASNAAQAARSGSSSKFAEFFKTTSSSVRQSVAARYQAIVAESSSTTGGATVYYCNDPYNYCSPNTLAYTLPSQNVVANCALVYTLPLLTRTCRQQDIATTVLHEFTHAPGVFSPGTQDYAYGYSASSSLSSSQALGNADTYALYANAILNGC